MMRSRLPALALLTTSLVLLLSSGASRAATSPATESGQPAKPFLLVEGEFDREFVSDLYTFSMDGKLIKRLTSEPLPTNHLIAVAPGRGDPFFEANASAFYGLSLRGNVLRSVHSSGIGAAAVSPNENTIAFVVEPDRVPGEAYVSPRRGRAAIGSGPPLLLRVLVSSPWRAMQFPLPAGVVPTEMTFAPDGEHLLITHWPDGERTARILLTDLKSGTTRTVLASDSVSYYQAVFAPDGKSLLAVREDLNAGRWSIVSLAWPAATTPAVILTAPLGVSLSTPIFLADGRRFLFFQNSAMARATLDGRTVDTLFGTLEQKDHDWRPGMQHFIDRANPGRASFTPGVVTRYIARVEWRERETPTAVPLADVIVIDVQTGQRTTVPMPSTRVRTVVVVE